MSANSSFSSTPHLPSSALFYTRDQDCYLTAPSSFIFTAFNTASLFLTLPLIILSLHVAFRGRRRNRFHPSASTMSHFDCFTHHSVSMEILCFFRGIPIFYGAYTNSARALFVGGLFSSFLWYGETAFHVLTCVERYLAVVHPIVYLSLRNKRGIRIRNISIACVWLLCFVRTSLCVMEEVFIILDIFFLTLVLLVTFFCSLSVLCVLVRPGPGENARGRVDQSKKKTFYTLMTIQGVLMLRFVSSLVWTGLISANENNECLILACIDWCNLPSALVLPLLFLYKEGKFTCCRSE